MSGILKAGRASTTPQGDGDRWRTPPDLFARLDRDYGPFDLDAAAEAHNALTPRWLGPGSALAVDARAVRWAEYGRRVIVNPPYSPGMIAALMVRGWELALALDGAATFIVPSNTDTGWYHDFIWDQTRRRFRRGVEVEFPKGRIKFRRPDGSRAGGGGFASMVVTFGGV